MSISTLENPASQRALAALHSSSEARERQERYLAESFEAAAQSHNLRAVADFTRGRHTIGELMLDAFEWLPRAEQVRVMELLAKAAWSNEAQTAQARTTINGMAWLWASQNATGDAA